MQINFAYKVKFPEIKIYFLSVNLGNQIKKWENIDS